jgi:transposase
LLGLNSTGHFNKSQLTVKYQGVEMSHKPSDKQYLKEFKTEAVALVLDQGYSVPDAVKLLGIAADIIHLWKEQQITAKLLVEDQREELTPLSKENKE